MKGWFDAFRHNGGPTLYDHANRTAVTADVPTITFCLIFITLFAAFLVIFPGIRKERLTTFTTVTLSLFTGAVILVSTYGSDWHVAEHRITSAYRAFSSEKIRAGLGIYIGLQHVNITLKSLGVVNTSEAHIDFNERFFWESPTEMHEGYHDALRRGLPYPLLTVAEYLSLDEEGFAWGRIYRNAGYYCGIVLWSSFASWGLMNILLLVVPRYGGYMMLLTGLLMILADIIYYFLIPHRRPLVIRFEEVSVSFRFGWCFWLVLGTGCLCVGAGVAISILEFFYPHKFSTVLELDYDTPYDRHIIIEDSHVQKRKPRLEEASGLRLSSRILRRLSKRGQSSDCKCGIDNPALEVDPPKSPWRYPHHERVAVAPSRTSSQKSKQSVNFENSAPTAGVANVEIPQDSQSQHKASSRSHSDWSTSSFSDVEEDVERIANTSIQSHTVDFQQQFRTSRMGSYCSQLSFSSSLSSRHSDGANNAVMDRDTSERRSGLGSISARISAAAEADRRNSAAGEVNFPVDLW